MKSCIPEEISVFDLDHTLCKANVSFQFGLYLVSQGQMPPSKIPYLMSCYGLHKLGCLSLSALHSTACNCFFKGKQLFSLQTVVASFLDKRLSTLLNPQILSFYETAKASGHFTALISSSPDFIVQEIARRLQFDFWEATRYEVLPTGVIENISSFMEGVGKVSAVERLVVALSLSMKHVTVYTDSYLDLPLLEACGRQVAVNPDKKLKKMARKQNWLIV